MRIVFFSFLVLFFFACKDEAVPEDVLPPSQMENILWDMVQADQLMGLQYATDTTINKLHKSAGMYQQILQLHKTTEADFKKSFRYYQTRPDLLRPILDSLRKRPPPVAQPTTKPV